MSSVELGLSFEKSQDLSGLSKEGAGDFKKENPPPDPSILIQSVYLEAFISKDDPDIDEKSLGWVVKMSSKFRELWENNTFFEGDEEGFQDLCLRILKEEDKQKQLLLLKEMSRRLGDGMSEEEIEIK